MLSVPTYSRYDPNIPLSIPFHPPCLQVFAQALKHQLFGKVAGLVDKSIVDKDTLYTAMSALHAEYHHHYLKIDYAELDETAREQYWGCMPGQEVRPE